MQADPEHYYEAMMWMYQQEMQNILEISGRLFDAQENPAEIERAMEDIHTIADYSLKTKGDE